MDDKEFLIWIYERLCFVHGENINVDYMIKLRCIIEKTGRDEFTPTTVKVEQEGDFIKKHTATWRK